MHYYAEHNRYGIGTMTTIRRGRREIVVSAGNLYRFNSRAARDAWVADDRWDGKYHRTALTAAEARNDHATGPLSDAVWDYPYDFMGQPVNDGPECFIEPRLPY